MNKIYYSDVHIWFSETSMLVSLPSISYTIHLSSIMDHFIEEGSTDLHIISMIYKTPKTLEPLLMVVHEPEDLTSKLPEITARKYLIFTNP